MVTDRARGAGGLHEQGAYESVRSMGRVGVLVLGEGYTYGLSGSSLNTARGVIWHVYVIVCVRYSLFSLCSRRVVSCLRRLNAS